MKTTADRRPPTADTWLEAKHFLALRQQPRHQRIRLALRPLFKFGLNRLARIQVRGVERIPPRGPLVLAFNHLAHLDPVLLYITMPTPPEIIGISQAWSIPLIGWFVSLYGGIPLKRDQFDRAVVEQALAVLNNNLMLALAPEARFSTTGQLEQGRTGAAYLAMKAGAPVLPVAITGTEQFGDQVKKLRRIPISVTYGTPLQLRPLPANGAERKVALRDETDRIMRALASMLPQEYRGVYR